MGCSQPRETTGQNDVTIPKVVGQKVSAESKTHRSPAERPNGAAQSEKSASESDSYVRADASKLAIRLSGKLSLGDSDEQGHTVASDISFDGDYLVAPNANFPIPGSQWNAWSKRLSHMGFIADLTKLTIKGKRITLCLVDESRPEGSSTWTIEPMIFEKPPDKVQTYYVENGRLFLAPDSDHKDSPVFSKPPYFMTKDYGPMRLSFERDGCHVWMTPAQMAKFKP
jgi:hypothetical protein